MMVAVIITCAFFNPRGNVPDGYIAVGWLLFVQEQIKVIVVNPHFVCTHTNKNQKIQIQNSHEQT